MLASEPSVRDVESRCDAVAQIRIALRFHSPLIKPDGRFSRIRLSDKAC